MSSRVEPRGYHHGRCPVRQARAPSAAPAGIVSLLEPLTATLLGVLVFGERLGSPGVVGAVLLLGAIVVLIRDERGDLRSG